jgi:hypothetical protein
MEMAALWSYSICPPLSMYTTWFSLNPLSRLYFLLSQPWNMASRNLKVVDTVDEKGKESGTEAKPIRDSRHHGYECITDVDTSPKKKRNRGEAGSNSSNYGYARLRARNASQLRARTRKLESLLFLPFSQRVFWRFNEDVLLVEADAKVSTRM